jgi:hypothetical protein
MEEQRDRFLLEADHQVESSTFGRPSSMGQVTRPVPLPLLGTHSRGRSFALYNFDMWLDITRALQGRTEAVPVVKHSEQFDL